MIQYLLAIVLTVSFSKREFFKVIDSKDKVSISVLEKKLKELPNSDDQKAYYGTILMKAADFEATPAEKIKKFKAGKALLEEAIANNAGNVEYRFLRLIIQENAPKVLKYNTHLKADADFIKLNMDRASNEIKAAIKDYSAISVSLQL